MIAMVASQITIKATCQQHSSVHISSIWYYHSRGFEYCTGLYCCCCWWWWLAGWPATLLL